jgi:hypothetical protein
MKFPSLAPVGCGGKIECCCVKNVGGGSVPGSACFAFHEDEIGGDDGLDISLLLLLPLLLPSSTDSG